MLKVTDPSNFGRSIAGLAMIAAPVTLAAGEVLRLSLFRGASGEQELLVAVSDSPAVWQLMTVINMVAVILFVPAVWGMIHLARRRAPVVAHIGGALALVGVLGAAGHNVFGNVLTGGMAASEDSYPLMEALGAEMEQTPGFLFVLLMFIAGFTLGLILLGVALYRSRTIGRVPAGAMVGGMLVFVTAGSSLPLTLVSSTLLIVGMGSAARHTLAQSDAEWASASVADSTAAVPAPTGAARLS